MMLGSEDWSHLEERYEIVSRKTLSTVVIQKIVRSVAEKISGIVTTESTLSVTSYIWTSKSGNDFISVTVHFIDADWQSQHLLEVWPFSAVIRWDRTHLLLERLCEQTHALALICQSNLGHRMEIANQDWELIDYLTGLQIVCVENKEWRCLPMSLQKLIIDFRTLNVLRLMLWPHFLIQGINTKCSLLKCIKTKLYNIRKWKLQLRLKLLTISRSVRDPDNTGSDNFGFMSQSIKKKKNKSGRATAQPDVGAVN
ncbi:hypothetical protein PR048_015988 [Dryococelus australis]|uniref:Uncharacterized protein n=1 Tax=Dryococelus australis TaxID=614101 RepID=A0ABQ9HIH1_9NEOP|nr:hypothetical protein PR048_015988 [Dryococelus australis]